MPVQFRGNQLVFYMVRRWDGSPPSEDGLLFWGFFGGRRGGVGGGRVVCLFSTLN